MSSRRMLRSVLGGLILLGGLTACQSSPLATQSSGTENSDRPSLMTRLMYFGLKLGGAAANDYQ